MNKPCKYCGYVAPRLSDEDCPANPNQPPTQKEAFDAMREALLEIVVMPRGHDDHSTLCEKMRQKARAALALADKVSK